MFLVLVLLNIYILLAIIPFMAKESKASNDEVVGYVRNVTIHF